MKIIKKNGFTLIELFITLGIMAILGFFVIPNFLNAYNQRVLESSAEELLGYLRDVHQKSVAQDDSCAWKVEIVSPSGGKDYYNIICSDTNAVQKTVYLSSRLKFKNPPQGSNMQIIFDKLTGYVASREIIALSLADNENIEKFIVVEMTGLVSIKSAAEVGAISIVKTIKEYGGDYASLFDWEADYGGIDFGACDQGDLVCANKIAVAQIEGNWTVPDTQAVTIQGWITSATNYIKIQGDATGVWDTNKYRLEPPAGITPLKLATAWEFDYIKIYNLQVKATNADGIELNSSSSPLSANMYIYNSIVRGVSIAGAWLTGISFPHGIGGKSLYLVNDIVYGWDNGSSTFGVAVDGGTIYAYNLTLYGNRNALFSSTDGTIYAKNVLAYNCSNQCYGTYGGGIFHPSSTNNLSSDNSTPAYNIYYRNKTVSFVSTISGSEDFHLLGSDVSAKDAGANLSIDPNIAFLTDVDGESRPFNLIWDVGADEWH